MTNHKTLQIDGDKTGALAFWEPRETSIDNLCSALEGVGRSKLLPKTSVAKASLKGALAELIRRSPLHVRGNVPEIFPLASHVVGFEARRMNRGDDENNPEFVMSAVLDSTGQVTIPKFDGAICPWLVGRKSQVEGVLQNRFIERATFFPTSMVSATIARVIQSLGGILVRKTGGNYFIPPGSLDLFEQFCNLLEQANPAPELVIYKFEIKPTERSFRQVLESVKREASERLAEVEKSLLTLGTDKKQRSNGKETRLNECSSVLDLLERYESVLGVDLQDFKAMAEKVRDAVGAHSVLELAC